LLSEVIERIKKPVNESLLKRAKFDNDWCRFHARISTQKEDTGDYYTTFKQNIERILTDPSKRAAFFDLMPFPFPTTQFISEAQDELNKAFYANDKEIIHELRNEELADDFELYLSDTIQLDDYLDKVYNLAFESPNNVLIFDLDKQVVDKWPNPYIFHVTPSEIVDIEVNNKGEITFIIFEVENEGYAVIDDTSYRLIREPKEDSYILELESFHSLGYCPACYVWGDTIEGQKGIRRYGPILPVLARLDRILRSEVFEEHADLFAAHPIMQIPENPCTVEGCEGGYITRHNDVTDQDVQIKCSCQTSKSIGPGSTIEVPTAAISEGIGSVVQYIESPVSSLQYFTEKVDKIKQQVYLSLTGGEYNQVTKEQQNEKQVTQGNERKRNRLVYIVRTLGLLRYDTAYKGSLIKYGVEFDLETLSDAVERYQSLKNAGMPQYLLGQQMRVIENLYSRSNTEYEKRSSIVRLIEPLRNVPIALIPTDSLDYQVKLRFLELIDEFELRNGSIANWGINLDLRTKVDLIKTAIYDYAKTANANGGGTPIGQKGDSGGTIPQKR
jgi:hypothetical protein